MYISIDIESTGVNPKQDQILEIGAVIDDCKSPISELPKFRSLIAHDTLKGDPEALVMNAALIEEISNGSEDIVQPHYASSALAYWMENENGIDLNRPITLAGKNIQGFDLPFLKELDHWNDYFTVRSRTIDPVALAWRPQEDEIPPTLDECKERCGITGKVNHTAVEDAIDVVRVLRKLAPNPKL